MAVTFAAADVPDRVDLLLNGEGYLLDRAEEPNALHAYTPTFVARQNVTGSYGDNQQEFWLVLSQNDWSEGEGQRYIRVNDPASSRRYWRGSAVDVSVEGQASLNLGSTSYSVSASVTASTSWRGEVAFVVGSDLFTVNQGASAVSRGATTSTLSGLTGYGMCADDDNVFIAYPSGGTNGCIRQWDGSAFTNFRASLGVSSVEFVNNILYGAGRTSGGNLTLYSFSTSGVPTTIREWLAADGTAETQTITRLRRMGDDLLILFSQHTPGRLLLYDGTGPNVIAELPASFYATEVVTSQGVVFIGGSYYKRNTSNTEFYQRPAILYYVDGRLDELWRADSFTATSYAIGATAPAANPVTFQRGILWWDSVRSQLTYYDLTDGSVSGVSAGTSLVGLGASASSFAWFNGPDASHAGQFPDATSVASTGYVRTSLFDADSSLAKYWKSVKVDADVPTGATFDIAYRTGDLDGAYTTLQSSASAGTEYALGVNARSISIQITLNKGSSTAGPTLKRIYLRGMPLLDTFRRESYVIDCSGRDQSNAPLLRDGVSRHPLTGLAQVTNLRTAAASTSPFTVVDELGSYTGLIEPESLQVQRIRDREYRVSLTVRQV